MFLKKKILCLIPARGGSKEIKLKNLKKINNKSLLSLSIEFAKSLKFLDDIIVSSENKKILKIAKDLNVKLHIRSKKLSGDLVSDIELILNILKTNNNNNFDYLLYLQPTSPFRFRNDFIKALTNLIKQKADATWSVTKMSNKYHPLKILKKYGNNYFKPYLPSGKKIVARQQLNEVFIRNGIFYFFSIKKLILNKTIYLKKSIPYVVNYEYVNIDNYNDLKLGRQLIKKAKGK